MNLVKGDKVGWIESVFHGGSFSRRRNKPGKYIGDRQISGVIERSSYGEQTTSHWLSIRVKSSTGVEPIEVNKLIRRKAKKIYANGWSEEGPNHSQGVEVKKYQKLQAADNCSDPIRQQILLEQANRCS